MAYLGRQLTSGNYLKLDDISSQFNGSTKTFDLRSGGNLFYAGSAFSILVVLGGVIQEPESAYTIDQYQITFASAPGVSDDFFCIALGVALGIGVPGEGTVTGTKLSKPFNYNNNHLTLDTVNTRVGINSSTPGYTLDINGDINFNGIFYQNGSQFVASRWTAGAGTTIYRNSSVGIGTTNPTSKLTVTGDVLVSGIVTATSFSGGGANLTSLTAGNLSGTIPSGVLGNSTLYVGTTAVTLNRSSSSQSLTGINIDGSSASCSGNSATATTATNQSGGTVSATTGSFSGQLQLASPSTYSAITSISIGNNYPILTPEVNAGSGGFTPIILQKTLVTGGYRQVLSMGSYRAGASSFNGGVFIAPGGGSDNNPTDYFLLSYGGSISYSGGSIGFGAITSSDTVTLTTKPFFRNVPTIAENYTVTTSYNEMSIGPITINSGITVTVNSGATWTVV